MKKPQFKKLVHFWGNAPTNPQAILRSRDLRHTDLSASLEFNIIALFRALPKVKS